jgi:hypothetical protein
MSIYKRQDSENAIARINLIAMSHTTLEQNGGEKLRFLKSYLGSPLSPREKNGKKNNPAKRIFSNGHIRAHENFTKVNFHL